MAANPLPDHAPKTVEHLLTYREMAKLLGVTERTVFTLVKTGELRAVRFRRSVRFDPADVRELIDRSKQHTPRGKGDES